MMSLLITETSFMEAPELYSVHKVWIACYRHRYGSGMLEDNLVARVYTSYETEGHFLAFYTVLNCYIYLLAYVYSPTSTQVYIIVGLFLIPFIPTKY